MNVGRGDLVDEAALIEMLSSGGEPTIILCGEQRGGNLAAAVAHRLRGTAVELAGRVLIYPGLGGDMSRGSYVRHAHAPMLTAHEVLFCSSVRADGDRCGTIRHSRAPAQLGSVPRRRPTRRAGRRGRRPRGDGGRRRAPAVDEEGRLSFEHPPG